jgi:hypothetical protein
LIFFGRHFATVFKKLDAVALKHEVLGVPVAAGTNGTIVLAHNVHLPRTWLSFQDRKETMAFTTSMKPI